MSDEAKICGYCFHAQMRNGRCAACGKAIPATTALALPVGSWLAGRYCVGYPIGEPGGFGIAYRCWEYDLCRSVVIKELFPGNLVTRYPGNSQVQMLNRNVEEHFARLRELFIGEARKLAQLEEVEAVVRVLSYFQENGTAYFVMPFVEGEPLSARIDPQQHLSAHDALMLLWPLLLGLAGVHRQGLLHRDIKPENVLVKKNGQPVLIDFGNATNLAALTVLEHTGFYAYSRHFSAPEQQANDQQRMGPCTDIYALCGLLYYAVSGQRPVDASERNAGVPLAPLRQLAPDVEAVPDLYIEVVERGLSLDEAQRPASADALIDALAPLAPDAAAHWVESLPANSFGGRMRRIHAAASSGRTLPVQWNLWAGIFQWFWLFAYRLPAPASGVAIVVLFAAGIGLTTLSLPIFLLTGLVITGILCAAFADALLYRRIATLGASLGRNSARAQDILAQAGLPHAPSMLIGLTVPILLLGFSLLQEGYEKNVQEQVARAISLPAVRQLYTEFWVRNGVVPPTLEDMGYYFTADSEVKELSLVGGELHVVLAIPEVAGRKFILRPEFTSEQHKDFIWRCKVMGGPSVYVPAACQ